MTCTSTSTAMLMAFSFLRGVGPASLRRIARISLLSPLDIHEVANSVPAVAKALVDPLAWTNALEAAAKQLDMVDQYHARVLSPLDEEYPKLLTATKDDPFLIYVRGSLALDPEKSIAIIGTREPTVHGREMAIRITQFCVEQGWSIVSGLAIGCDSIAHQAAVDAGGHTVAVMAHGLQMVAPSKHQKLADQILASGGALVSQFPFGQKVLPQQYVIRDRVQAGMAKAVIMIQSDVKGGSLHASRAALEYNRWLAVPYPTPADIERLEPKIQANLLISDGDDSAVGTLLRCPPTALQHVLIVRGKADYSKLVTAVSGVQLASSGTQTALV